MRRFFLEADVDAVVADLQGIRGNSVVVASGRFPRQWVEVPTVPGATEQAIFDRAFAKRSSLVGTRVVESSPLPLEMGEADVLAPAANRFDSPFGDFGDLGDLLPVQFLHVYPRLEPVMDSRLIWKQGDRCGDGRAQKVAEGLLLAGLAKGDEITGEQQGASKGLAFPSARSGKLG